MWSDSMQQYFNSELICSLAKDIRSGCYRKHQFGHNATAAWHGKQRDLCGDSIAGGLPASTNVYLWEINSARRHAPRYLLLSQCSALLHSGIARWSFCWPSTDVDSKRGQDRGGTEPARGWREALVIGQGAAFSLLLLELMRHRVCLTCNADHPATHFKTHRYIECPHIIGLSTFWIWVILYIICCDAAFMNQSIVSAALWVKQSV